MPRKGYRRQRHYDQRDPEGLGAWLKRYEEARRVRGYSPDTLRADRHALEQLLEWLDARSVTRPQQVTRPVLERYQRHLFYYRKADGKSLTLRAQQMRLVPVRVYFRWLTKQGVILANPAADLDLPRRQRQLPKCVLTALEVEKVLEQPDVTDVTGLRDRALLELLYSTGVRRKEVARIGVYDIDMVRGTLLVREGKGRKDRVVPVGERAMYWVGRYLDEGREQLVMPPDEQVLFLTRWGEGFVLSTLSNLVRAYVDAAELGKRGSCHLLRHTCATLMHENGADIRHIQELLGHAELSTTQIYVHLGIRQLKAVHEATHPAAKLPRPLAKAGGSEDEVLAGDEDEGLADDELDDAI